MILRKLHLRCKCAHSGKMQYLSKLGELTPPTHLTRNVFKSLRGHGWRFHFYRIMDTGPLKSKLRAMMQRQNKQPHVDPLALPPSEPPKYSLLRPFPLPAPPSWAELHRMLITSAEAAQPGKCGVSASWHRLRRLFLFLLLFLGLHVWNSERFSVCATAALKWVDICWRMLYNN